ncbi:TIGR02391 family protein [Streptomyces sp. NPDC060006]|uniref:TIGR02391 family protein n=1 Tax=unclassified Streptomyces TaxID=2593676 RepID=UPI0036CD8951
MTADAGQVRDLEWARRRLVGYLNAVRAYDSVLHDENRRFDSALYEEAIKLEPAAKEIMRRIDPNFEEYDLVMSASRKALDSTLRAISLIDDAEELKQHLGPIGPQLSASDLHPWVWEAAKSLWETEHYRAAVQVSATSINAHLQKLSGRKDVSDLDLLLQLLSKETPSPGKPRLRWPADPNSDEYKSMESGLRGYASGIYQCIRNRVTHDIEELTEQEGLERLAAMSLLCHWLQMCDMDQA